MYAAATYSRPRHRHLPQRRPINHNLEQQAQALYKSWFVDFEPFKDGSFVNSELGPIPEGWSIKHAADICTINIGKTPPRQEHQWFSNAIDAHNWVSISDMANCGVYISNTSERLTNEAVQKFNISLVPKDTILLSFKLTIGRVAISNCELTTNEAIARFLTCPSLKYYLYLLLKNYDYNKLGSTSSIATAVNSKIIKSMLVLTPTDTVLNSFANCVDSFFENIRNRQIENSSLMSIRDSLLPKLMSGALNINEIVR